ncbi:type IV secretory system conjugative DNA transfer family protein [Bradyrhizobium elkanii]|uniref:type IV secretory system conjugative DNA transfer family protein n=1 Tax=Bradyrhizobium elkanii TaxID=29448 RepID=UPI0035182706
MPSFATTKEMAAMTGNIILGQTERKGGNLVHFPLSGSAITIAACRTGKTSSLIIPNAATWKGHLFVLDTGGEVFNAVGRQRSETRTVHRVEPFADSQEGRITMNPLEFIKGPEDVDTIVDLLVPHPRDHFRACAAHLIRGFLFMMCIHDPELLPPRDLVTMRAYLEMLSSDEQDVTVSHMMHGGDISRNAITMLLSMGDKERRAVLSTVKTLLSWLDIKPLARAVEESSFQNGVDEDLFVIVPPQYMDRAAPFLRLIVGVMAAVVMRRRPEEKPDHVLMLIDNAPEIGRVVPLMDAFRVGCPLKLSVWLFAQTIGRLEKAYGKETLADMIGNAEFVNGFSFGIGDQGSSNWFSRALLPGTRDTVMMDHKEMLFLPRSPAMRTPMRIWQASCRERPEIRALVDLDEDRAAA